MPVQEMLVGAGKPMPQECPEHANSTLKTILVHVQNDGSAHQRIEAALALARAAGAHLSCLHVTPIEAYVAFESFGGVFVMNDVMKAIDDEVARLKTKVEEELRGEDVSWDYVPVTGNVVSEIVGHAALADLIVTGREPARVELGRPVIGLLGDLLQRSRTPLFIPGSVPPDPAGSAIIAWDGSYEAANAVRGAVGLLKLAREVRVVQVSERAEKKNSFPGTKLLEYLSRQGIHADLIVESSNAGADNQFVAASLIAHARAVGNAYVVMGGYGHSRVREYLFGGVTRIMLGEASVPLLISG